MPPGDRDALAAFMATPRRDRADDADPGISKDCEKRDGRRG
jgi:hypothetical protein